MAKDKCIIPKAPNGENSKLYSNLQSLCADHLLANYVYATYHALDIASQMDAAGIKRGKQGEHSAKEVYAFLKIAEMVNDQSKDVSTVAKNIGAVDSSGNFIDFTDAEDALSKCAQFNETSKGKVAYVVQRGESKFNILVDNKDSRSQIKTLEVSSQLKLWDIFKTELGKIGVNLSDIAYSNTVANPLQITSFVEYLQSLRSIRNDIASLRDIKTLLAFDPNNSLLKTAISRYGNADAVAQAIYDTFHTTSPKAGKAFLTNLMNSLKNSANLTTGLTEVSDILAVESINFRVGKTEQTIQEKLDTLHRDYGIDINYIVAEQTKITKLSDAVANAAVTLQRQIRYLETQEGRTSQGKEIENTLKTLMNELQRKHYYHGMLTFLNNALKYATSISDSFNNISPGGTAMEYASRKAKILMQATTMQNGYLAIVNALSSIDNLIIDENITDSDKAQVQSLALEVKNALEFHQRKMREVKEDTMLDIVTSILGEEDYNGLAIANLIKMAEVDSSSMDFLYAASKTSNPVLAAMGTVIRRAQLSRNKKMNEISQRIREITNKLRKARGRDTSFMLMNIYRDTPGKVEYRIITEEGIDWASYEKARAKARWQYEKRGLKGFLLKEALEQWEEDNTISKVVDFKSGRTERIPNNFYRLAVNPYDSLTDAQKEYYKEIMQIKGELGTLMPSYAQDQYRPVQKRSEWYDIIADGIRGKLGAKAIAKIILDRLNLLKIKADDTFFNKNGVIINGDTFGITESDFKGTMMRQIPIFYFNKLTDQNELLQDFSGSIQLLAGTAINYDAMNEVRDIVETMEDFLETQKVSARRYGKKLVDKVQETDEQAVVTMVAERCRQNTKTAALAEGYVSKYIYGQQTRKNLSPRREILVNIARGLIAYNSFKGLALNLKGAVSNYIVGEYQMLTKAIGGTFTGVDYNVADYAAAHAILLGRDGVMDAPGEIMDIFTNNVNSKGKLLELRFDPLIDSFDAQSRKRYTTIGRTLLGGFNAFGMYASGEYLIHYTNMYAMLLHQKVWNNGKRISLYHALKVANKKNGNSELVIMPGTTLDKEGTQAVTEEFLDTMRDKIRFVNQQCHGSMSEEDKGLIHTRMVGKFIMNFRQWMVEHYSRRYRGKHWDASLNGWNEGFYTTVGKFLWNLSKEIFRFEADASMRWSNLDMRSKQNIAECFSSLSLLTAMLLLDVAIGPVDGVGVGDDKQKRWWKRFWLYQLKRLLLDAKASTPIGTLLEAKTVINSPVPAVNTVNGLLYLVVGWGDWNKTIQSGPYKGWNKWNRNVLKYATPFWYQIEQLKRMDKDENVFYIFQPEQYYR